MPYDSGTTGTLNPPAGQPATAWTVGSGCGGGVVLLWNNKDQPSVALAGSCFYELDLLARLWPFLLVVPPDPFDRASCLRRFPRDKTHPAGQILYAFCENQNRVASPATRVHQTLHTPPSPPLCSPMMDPPLACWSMSLPPPPPPRYPPPPFNNGYCYDRPTGPAPTSPPPCTPRVDPPYLAAAPTSPSDPPIGRRRHTPPFDPSEDLDICAPLPREWT